jgi:hypothetical protein
MTGRVPVDVDDQVWKMVDSIEFDDVN